jgi:lysophospholipase L1-like esterase
MDIESNRPHTAIDVNYQKALNTLVSNIASTCSQYRVRPLLVYHPYLLLQNDGTAKTDTDKEYFGALQRACKAAHVKLIDMSDMFLAAYRKSHILPNGFINTHVGTGHLNTDGHRMIAEKLYAYISQGNK